MQSIIIPKGAHESAPCILGHKKLGTVFTPPIGGDENLFIEILGSHDGKSYGSINGGLKFIIQSRYSVSTFDSQIFAGIQYIKLYCDTKWPEDLEFFVHLADT